MLDIKMSSVSQMSITSRNIESSIHSGARIFKLSKSICLGLMVVFMTSLLESPISLMRVNQVEAILLPKARICFNSMSNTFQSECVYCDSRLYASTITACTGQPVLANNVTQAQAFCIATACLQVPVLFNKRTHPMLSSLSSSSSSTMNRPMASGNNLLERTTSKMNLFRSYLWSMGPNMKRLLFPNSNNNNINHKRTSSSNLYSNDFPFITAQHRYKRELYLDRDDSGKIDDLIGNLNHSLMADNLSIGPTRSYRNRTDISDDNKYKHTSSSSFDEAPPTLTAAIEESIINTSNRRTTTSDLLLPALTSGSYNSLEFPNFNQMHAKIRTGILSNNQLAANNYLMTGPHLQRPYLSSALHRNDHRQQSNILAPLVGGHRYGNLHQAYHESMGQLPPPPPPRPPTRPFVSLDQRTPDYIRSAALSRLAELISSGSDKLAWKRQALAQLVSNVHYNHNRLANMQRQMAESMLSYHPSYRYYAARHWRQPSRDMAYAHNDYLRLAKKEAIVSN